MTQDTQGSEAYSIVPSRKLHKILTIPNMTFQHNYYNTRRCQKNPNSQYYAGFSSTNCNLQGQNTRTKNDWRNAPVILLRRVGYFSPPKEETTSACNVENKKHIIKSEWKRKGPLVLSYALVMQRLYFSQFFTCFFWGLHQICSRSNVRLFIACKLCGW